MVENNKNSGYPMGTEKGQKDKKRKIAPDKNAAKSAEEFFVKITKRPEIDKLLRKLSKE